MTINNYNIVISCDPGQKGGFSIFKLNNGECTETPDVMGIPLKKIIKNKKEKNVYDLNKIVNIFNEYCGQKVIFVQELVGVKPGEGTVSAMSFGKSLGQLEGLVVALGFDYYEIPPQTWKKGFASLETKEITELREKAKKIKSDKLNKQDKKEIRGINNKIKEEAKNAARYYVSSLYPNIKDKFELKKDDGKAESVLIGLYIIKNGIKINEENSK